MKKRHLTLVWIFAILNLFLCWKGIVSLLSIFFFVLVLVSEIGLLKANLSKHIVKHTFNIFCFLFLVVGTFFLHLNSWQGFCGDFKYDLDSAASAFRTNIVYDVMQEKGMAMKELLDESRILDNEIRSIKGASFLQPFYCDYLMYDKISETIASKKKQPSNYVSKTWNAELDKFVVAAGDCKKRFAESQNYFWPGVSSVITIIGVCGYPLYCYIKMRNVPKPASDEMKAFYPFDYDDV